MTHEKDISESTFMYLAHKLKKLVSERLEIIAGVSAGLDVWTAV